MGGHRVHQRRVSRSRFYRCQKGPPTPSGALPDGARRAVACTWSPRLCLLSLLRVRAELEIDVLFWLRGRAFRIPAGCGHAEIINVVLRIATPALADADRDDDLGADQV